MYRKTKKGITSKGFNRSQLGGSSNTRLNHTKRKAVKQLDGWSVGFDYLRVQIPKVPFKVAISIVQNYFRYELVREYRENGWSAPGHNDRYTDRYRDGCTNGFLLIRPSESSVATLPSLYVTGVVENVLVDVWLELPGKWWIGVTVKDGINLVYYLVSKLNGHITRLDLRVDMYDNQILVADVDNAVVEKNFALVRKCTKYTIHSSKKEKATVEGYTFGSRESDIYTRYYDANEVHGIPARRWEAEYKGIKCKGLVSELLDLCHHKDEMVKRALQEDNTKEEFRRIEKQLATIVAQYAFGGVEFIERSRVGKSGNLKKRHRLAWWVQILESIGDNIRLSITAPRPKIQTTKGHLERISKSMAMLKKAMGAQVFFAWMRETLAVAQEKLSPYHLQAIQQYHTFNEDWELDDIGNVVFV